MVLNLKDDLYELKGSVTHTRESDDKEFVYSYWYVAVKDGKVHGAEGFVNDWQLEWRTMEEISERYNLYLSQDWIEHREWMETKFNLDFEDWLCIEQEEKEKETCKWHNQSLTYTEKVDLRLVTSETVPEAIERATKHAQLTMREWPDCQRDPLIINADFNPGEKTLSFSWYCMKHDHGK